MMHPGVQPFQYVHGTNSAVEWKNWLKTFEIFMKACNNEKEEGDRCAKLLHYAGPKVQQVYFTLKDPVHDENTHANQQGPWSIDYVQSKTEYDRMVEKLNGFFAPKRNATYERHLFRKMKQSKGEKIDTFVMRLRQQAELCEYADRIEEFIKDQLTEGCTSGELRKKILKRSHDSLDEILKNARIDEIVTEEHEAFKNSQGSNATPVTEEVHKIESNTRFQRKQWQGNSSKLSKFGNPLKFQDTICNRCGFKGHIASDVGCPAKGKQCHKCGGRDHFQRKCLSKKRRIPKEEISRSEKKPKIEEEKVQLISNYDKGYDDDKINIDKDGYEEDCMCITTGMDNTVKCKIGGIEATAIIDSGCLCDLVDEKTWLALISANVVVHEKKKDSDRNFKTYGGHSLTVLGTFLAVLETYTKKIQAKFTSSKARENF